MDQQHLPDIAQDIQRILHKQGKDYLTIRQISASLSQRVRQQLSLTTHHATVDMLKKLTPWLGENLQVYHGPTSIYIGHKRSPAEIILQGVQQHPGISPKQLGLGLPLSKRIYITALNDLLGTGTVVCTFKDNHMPMLHLSSQASAQGTAQDGAATTVWRFTPPITPLARGAVSSASIGYGMPCHGRVSGLTGYCEHYGPTIPWNCTGVILL